MARTFRRWNGFYREVIGLRLVSSVEERSRGFRVSSTQVLLVFRASVTRLGHPAVPTHGAIGEGHVAFAIDKRMYDTWKEKLARDGVAIEQEVEWPLVPEGQSIRTRSVTARSIYMRDPARNSVELVEGEVWPE